MFKAHRLLWSLNSRLESNKEEDRTFFYVRIHLAARVSLTAVLSFQARDVWGGDVLLLSRDLFLSNWPVFSGPWFLGWRVRPSYRIS